MRKPVLTKQQKDDLAAVVHDVACNYEGSACWDEVLFRWKAKYPRDHVNTQALRQRYYELAKERRLTRRPFRAEYTMPDQTKNGSNKPIQDLVACLERLVVPMAEAAARKEIRMLLHDRDRRLGALEERPTGLTNEETEETVKRVLTGIFGELD